MTARDALLNMGKGLVAVTALEWGVDGANMWGMRTVPHLPRTIPVWKLKACTSLQQLLALVDEEERR